VDITKILLALEMVINEENKQVMYKFVKKNVFPAREKYIDAQKFVYAPDMKELSIEEMDKVIKDLRSYYEHLNIDWEKFRQKNREDSLQAVKKRMVLNQIAKQEDLEVTEEELNAEIEKIVKKSGESFAAVRNYLAKEGRTDAVKKEMLQRKTLDFLRDKAIILNKGR